ncbi:putative S-adenosylmethionine-dependent methyltransferase [Leptospira ryugenii]|uniref:Putative S-adenosylmethionine-dependent methyltransferase n=1 Tax=Leptospira ryugenii TaxID=1917863 RepID=A0A2P2DXC4_9LEPT|nr:methyltransferase domain-containing protein [Leptospira ryugenii]GBF49279.1 putative S-adenosylmethionine-dependent methyltransferase [Leptospira ryugenii]
MSEVWDKHYQRGKSKLSYPDENLVRLLARIQTTKPLALDFGSGSGRHVPLLEELGFQVEIADASLVSVANLKNTFPEAKIYHTPNPPLPFQRECYGLIVSWGVFHYNKRDVANQMVSELKESLVPQGYLLGSVRANTDTHLALQDGKMQLEDLQGGYAETYSEEELRGLLSGFADVQLGYSERTPLGKLNERICHWFFLARKG